jgi:hypothetical protein
MSSLKRFEGYLLTDHRAGPGIPSLGLPGGEVVEVATLTCWHCRGCFIPDPTRQHREYCRSCDRYLCNPCARTAAKPGYIHRSFDEIADLVRSGRFTLHGPMSDPVLIPTSKELTNG